MSQESTRGWVWSGVSLHDDASDEHNESTEDVGGVTGPVAVSPSSLTSPPTAKPTSMSGTLISATATPSSVPSHDWLEYYYQNLSYSSSAIKQVKNRTSLIADHIKSSVDQFSNPLVWGEGRTRRGLVIGSVQSGKTASMLGVIASSLNQGTDIVVLLSGTKISLMQQTIDRMYDDLIPPKDTKYAYVLPRRSDANVTSDKIGWSPSMTSSRQKKYTREITESLQKGKKIILGVMKQKDHLINVSKILEDAVNDLPSTYSKSIHMLVVDDESDDASILDTQDTKSTPTRICRLWSGTKSSIDYHHTHNENLFATYIGYTATPQANILQEHENPLYPENFIFSLKTPHFEAIPDDQSSYVETDGIKATYTGGEIFYNTEFSLQEASITCTEFSNGNRIDLAGPIRAFLVGAAIHLLEAKKLPPDVSNRYSSSEDAMNDYLEPFTMVYHPSAMTGEHFGGRDSIIDWINTGPPEQKPSENEGGDLGDMVDEQALSEHDSPTEEQQRIEHIDPDLLKAHLNKHEKDWRNWVQRFDESSQEWNNILGKKEFSKISFSWPKIKNAIFEKVLPCLKIRVLNSTVDADDKPKFKPWQNPDNPREFMPQTDSISIFVAGNVLGRGLTIEGLRVTAFERSSTVPAQDTQMQMQRWFGYRGQYLPKIRLFLSEAQLDFFYGYHQSDVVVKNIVLSKEATIDVRKKIDFQPDILTSIDTVPTLKTAASRRPIHPGKFPAFMVFNESEDDKKHNLSSLSEFADSLVLADLQQNTGTKIGYIANEEVSSQELAKFLNKLHFTTHKPGLKHPDFKRWENYNVNYNLGIKPGTICRTFGSDYGDLGEINTENSPYTIAAYLKVWLNSTTLNRSFTYAPDNEVWDGTISAPKFRVVLLNGNSGGTREIQDKNKATYKIKLSERSPESNFWGNGTGSTNRYDDKLVDFHAPKTGKAPMTPTGGGKYEGTPEPRYVQGGDAGLMIIRLIEVDGLPSMALGFSLPIDGPAHLLANN